MSSRERSKSRPAASYAEAASAARPARSNQPAASAAAVSRDEPVAEIGGESGGGVEGGRIVPTDHLRDLVGLRLTGLLEPLRHPHVQARAFSTGETRVADVAEECMTDDERLAEKVVGNRAADDSASLERLDPVAVVGSQSAEYVQGELSPGDRRSTDHRARCFGKIVELCGVHALDGRGQLDLPHVARQPPARRGRLEQPAAGPGPEEFLDEEGIASGLLDDSSDELLGERFADQGANETASRRRRERFELQNLAARDPLGVGLEKRRAGRADDESADSLRRRSQECAVVAPSPVDILDEPDLGAFTEGCEACGPGREARRAASGVEAVSHVLRGVDERCELVGDDCRAGFAERDGQPVADRVTFGETLVRKSVCDEIGDGTERREHVGTYASSTHGCSACLREPRHLLQQPGLAGSRRCDDGEPERRVGRTPIEGLADPGEVQRRDRSSAP